MRFSENADDGGGGSNIQSKTVDPELKYKQKEVEIVTDMEEAEKAVYLQPQIWLLAAILVVLVAIALYVILAKRKRRKDSEDINRA